MAIVFVKTVLRFHTPEPGAAIVHDQTRDTPTETSYTRGAKLDSLSSMRNDNDREPPLQEPYNWDHLRDDAETWDQVRSNLVLGQRVNGTVGLVPRPGTVGVFVDLGLPVAGFVDVLLLPDDVSRWPAEGTVMEFLVWWMDPKKSQIRLVPVDPRFRRDDFDTWLLTNAPGNLDPEIWS